MSFPPCPMFRLPLELRQEIYSHVCPPEPVSYPIPKLNIISVSHRPPCPALLAVNSQLATDIQAHYYQNATWKFIVSHAFNYYRVDPQLSNLASSPVLKEMQKVELVLFFDGSLLRSYPSFGADKMYAEIKHRAARFCEILTSAPNLAHVRVSWIDTTTGGSSSSSWEEKASILEPLAMLKDKVRLTAGDMEWPAAPDAEGFRIAVKKILEDPPHARSAGHWIHEPPACRHSAPALGALPEVLA